MVEKKKADNVLLIEKAIFHSIVDEGLSLIDIDIRYSGNDTFVTIYVYAEKLDLVNLGKLNKKLYPLLEELSFLKDRLNLEVSSPGIFRKIKYASEFLTFKDRNIRISLEKGLTLEGKIENYENNTLSIVDKDGNIIDIKNEDIKNCHLNG